MAELSVDTVYGQAFFEAARDTGKTELLREELCQVVEILKNEPQFLELINTPVISAMEKKAAVKKVFGGQVSNELTNLFYVLIDKGRTHHFIKIAAQFEKLIQQERQISSGVIYSVQPLTEEEVQSFEEKVGTLLKKKVELVNRIDKTMIGGVKIFIEGKVIDATVRRQLRDLGESFRQAAI